MSAIDTSPDGVPIPWLVGSATDVPALEEYAARPTSQRDADLVEARFDLYPDEEWDAAFAACRNLELTRTPTLATLRLGAEGGEWTRLDELRAEFFRRAIRDMSWIDVEARSAIAAQVAAWAHAAGKRVIVSYHDFEGAPAAAMLEGIRSQCLDRGADVAKLAVMPRDAASDRRLLDFARSYAARGDTCVVAMGDRARELRASLPAAGSVLTFAALSGPTAPGQWPIAELAQRLCELMPYFRERRKARASRVSTTSASSLK